MMSNKTFLSLWPSGISVIKIFLNCDIIYIFFHGFIHVDILGSGADTSKGTDILCQKNYFVTMTNGVSLKNLFEL